MSDGLDIALVTAATPPAGVDRSFMAATDAPLVDALRTRGVRVATPSWRDDESWERFDLVLVRTTWDYVGHRDEFIAWAAEVDEATRLYNAFDVLRWNTHKGYLLELEERGAPVVPTAWLAAGDRVGLREVLEVRQWCRAVVKPTIGAGSRDLLRVGRRETDTGQQHLDRLLASGDVMIQRYLPSVESNGELSVVVVDGRVSHAVRKRPAAEDFRVQHAYGGDYVVEEVPATTVQLVEWIVEATGHDLLVARVDLLEDEVGSLQLTELEATEPDLYLSTVPAAAERLADAIIQRSAR